MVAIANEAFAALAPVIVHSPNGTQRPFGLGTSTTAGRYALLRAARTFAAAGDTIHVGPGTYDCTSGNCNLLKDGVNWYFAAGAIVTASTVTEGAIFDDSEFSDVDAGVTCRIMGHGIFKRSGASAATDLWNCVLVTNPASYIVLDFDEVRDESLPGLDGTYGIAQSGIRHTGGTLYARGSVIWSTNGTAFWWDSGDSYIQAQLISGHSAIYFDPDVDTGYDVSTEYDLGTEVWVTAQDIRGTGANTAFSQAASIFIEGTTANALQARVWVECQTLYPPVTDPVASAPCIEMNGTKAYFKINKIAQNTDSNAQAAVYLADGDLWMDMQKITCARAALLLSGGTSRIKLHNIEDPDNRANYGIRATAGSHTVTCNEITVGTGGTLTPVGPYGVVVDSGATLRLVNATVTTLDNSHAPIQVNSGGTLYLEGATRVVPAGTISIGGSGTVKCVGSVDPTTGSVPTTMTYGRAHQAAIQLKMLGTVATGDGKDYFVVPSTLAGRNILSARAVVAAAGTTGNMDLQIARIRAGASVDVFSTKPRIETTETSNATGIAGTVNTSNDDLADGDLLRLDIDSIQTTPATSLVVVLITD